ncbi:MAG: CRISPR-associated endonuclease Cas1 [Gammaproteobacteria bacterium]
MTLWIPYLQKISKKKVKRWEIRYNGGEYEADLSRIDGIMFYGASGDLPLEFIDALGTERIPAIVHRRNMMAPTIILPAPKIDPDDILTKQILARINEIRSVYVARSLILARFGHSLPLTHKRKFNSLRKLSAVRAKEAEWAKRHWRIYFSELGMSDVLRRSDEPVSKALDACSFFLFSVMLRWILLHHLSPQHGFLHQPTGYPSLVYDLLEPYRYVCENAVAEAIKLDDNNELTHSSLSAMKRLLDEVVYVPVTRQHVRRKHLLHGVVLALRSWLVGDTKRFVVPLEGRPNGGRPLKVAYRLPGSTKTRRDPL